MRLILEEFNKQQVDAVILDLRRNGGGSLQEAISLTGLFIEDGPVVQVKDANGDVHAYMDNDNGSIVWKGPLVVMISKFSASASEILAGAIQDYKRGLIIGDHATHGKGTVQSLMDLGAQLFQGIQNAPSLGALKITMQQFYRPSGESTQNRGVVSDIELPSLTTHYDIGEADLDYAVPFDRVDPVQHRNYGQVSDAIRQQLQRLSDKRRSDSSDSRECTQHRSHWHKRPKVTSRQREVPRRTEGTRRRQRGTPDAGADRRRRRVRNPARNVSRRGHGDHGRLPAPVLLARRARKPAEMSTVARSYAPISGGFRVHKERWAPPPQKDTGCGLCAAVGGVGISGRRSTIEPLKRRRVWVSAAIDCTPEDTFPLALLDFR